MSSNVFWQMHRFVVLRGIERVLKEEEKKKEIRAAGIEPATLRLLQCSHYSLTLFQLS